MVPVKLLRKDGNGHVDEETIFSSQAGTLESSFNPKRQTKIAADDILIFHFYHSKKIWLDFSCESSA